jgi:hypothetical protein
VAKPWTKIWCAALGVGLGFLYQKKINGDFDQSFLAKKSGAAWAVVSFTWIGCLATLGWAVIMNKSANLNPDTWSHAENFYYVMFMPLLYVFLLLLIFTPMFFGYGFEISNFWSGPTMKSAGKLTYGAFLLVPITMDLRVCSVDRPVLVTLTGTPYFALVSIA